MIMTRIKNLANWIDQFCHTSNNQARIPWIDDSMMVLKLLTHILHRDILLESSHSEDANFSIACVNFNELSKLSERHLGLSLPVTNGDINNHNEHERNLALFLLAFSIWLAVNGIDTKSFRNADFSKISIELLNDLTPPPCDICKRTTTYIERLIIQGHVFHRTCLKCSNNKCARQLSRGNFFKNIETKAFECFEHFANSILYGDSMCRYPDELMATKNSPLALRPPIRPPAPKLTRGNSPITAKDNDSSDSIAIKLNDIVEEIAKAIHDTQTIPVKREIKEIGEKSWEVLEYPEELNPFGTDCDDLQSSDVETITQPNSTRSIDDQQSSMERPSSNPFDELELDTLDNAKHIEKGAKAVIPLRIPNKLEPFEPISTPEEPTHLQLELKHDTNEEKKQKQVDEENGTRCQDKSLNAKKPVYYNKQAYEYVPPLALPINRSKSEQMHYKEEGLELSYVQKLLKELDVNLRKLSNQIEQYEITGCRLEKQALRILSNSPNGDKNIWKMKVFEDYAQIFERRCEALRTESSLIRRYVHLFLIQTHAELDKQMKSCHGNNSEHSELLARLLEIKNELTCLEKIELEKTASASASSPKGPPFRFDKSLKLEAKNTFKKLKKKF